MTWKDLPVVACHTAPNVIFTSRQCSFCKTSAKEVIGSPRDPQGVGAGQVSVSMLINPAIRMVALKTDSCRVWESFALVVFESVNVTQPEGQGAGALRKKPEGTISGDGMLVQHVQKWHSSRGFATGIPHLVFFGLLCLYLSSETWVLVQQLVCRDVQCRQAFCSAIYLKDVVFHQCCSVAPTQGCGGRVESSRVTFFTFIFFDSCFKLGTNKSSNESISESKFGSCFGGNSASQLLFSKFSCLGGSTKKCYSIQREDKGNLQLSKSDTLSKRN